MATFPTLPVTGRTFSEGVYPHTRHGVYSGREVRVRHSNSSVDNRLRLQFGMITTAEMLDALAHYRGQRGGVLAFEIPDALLLGVNTPADFTPAGHRWMYASPPKVVDVPLDEASPVLRHLLEVELRSLPAEGVLAPGARWRVTTRWRPGYAPRPRSYAAMISWAPGAPYGLVPGLIKTVAASWAPGPVPRPSAFMASASLAAGKAGAPGLAITVSATFVGGAGYEDGSTPPPAPDSLFLRPVWAFDPLFLWDDEDA
jgi:hypothetical protein